MDGGWTPAAVACLMFRRWLIHFCKKYLKQQNVQRYYILDQNWVCSMSICEGGYNQLYIVACKSNWPKYIILITMIDVRLQSLKPPAIQYASVQPQSTQQMTSRMGCCVLGQGFYPRSCCFKSELLFISEAEGSSTCVGDIGSPLMMPEGGGRFFSQVHPFHRICLICLIANFGFFTEIPISLSCSLLLWNVKILSGRTS